MSRRCMYVRASYTAPRLTLLFRHTWNSAPPSRPPISSILHHVSNTSSKLCICVLELQSRAARCSYKILFLFLDRIVLEIDLILLISSHFKFKS